MKLAMCPSVIWGILKGAEAGKAPLLSFRGNPCLLTPADMFSAQKQTRGGGRAEIGAPTLS